jgi:hypothetical protein
MKYSTAENWAKYFEETEGVQIHDQTIRHRLKKAEIIGKTGRNKMGRVLKNAFFSESDVRSTCDCLLHLYPQVDETDFFTKDGDRYGTVASWQNELGISIKAILNRINEHKIQSIRGRAQNGNIHDFYSESEIRRICAELLHPLPCADNTGFFTKYGERYGTVVSWKNELGVSQRTISSRFINNKIQSIRGKMQGGQAYNFYSESEIRRVCAEFLQPLPQANKEGFFVKDGERYRTMETWPNELGVSQTTISFRIKTHKIQSIRGKALGGQICDFYSESSIRQICPKLLQSLLQADKNGFFEKVSKKYGTIRVLSKALGISDTAIMLRIATSKIEVIKGKDKGGRVQNYYPVSIVREICADLLQDLPHANEEGLFLKDGERYGTNESWSKILGISTTSIASRIKKNNIQAIKGKIQEGNICDFYPESAMRQMCSSLLQDIPQADKDGLIIKDGQRYGTISRVAKLMGISVCAVLSRLKLHNAQSIKGKTILGRIRDFFPESSIRQICADLLAKKKTLNS